MSVESDADRGVFVGKDEFGAIAIYTEAGGSPISVNGIFDNDYQLLSAFGEVGGIGGSQPAFHLVSSVLPVASAIDDSLTVNATNYKIVEIMPDGTGMTVLKLMKV